MQAARALATAALVALAAAGPARAEPVRCRAGEGAAAFPICFDPGNRLTVGGEVGFDVDADAAPGTTFAAAFRHASVSDDAEVTWRLEHVVLDGGVHSDAWRVALYRGRYLRHARDGRIVIPSTPPRKVFLPFDLGVEADVGAIAGDGVASLEVGVVRSLLFVELLRSPSFRRRLTIGPVARWDLDAERAAGDDGWTVGEHRAAPFTMAAAALHLERLDGLQLLDVAVEGGRAWSTTAGWRWEGRARLAVERVVAAVNDRPLSLIGELHAAVPGDELAFTIGLRVGVIAAATPP